MNSTTNVTIQIDALKQSLINFVKINGSIVIPSLSGIGFFLNFVALLALLNPKFKQKKQLKYVIVNVTIETFICGALIFFTDELCFAQCTIFKPYSSQFFKIYLNFFLGNTLFLFTGFIEVCLTYDRYLTLKKTENWFTKETTFKYLIILFTIISTLVFVPFLFAFAITESPNNPNLYYIKMINFGKTNIYSISIILVLGGIDLLVVTALILLSWLVIKEFKVFKQNNIQESRIKITNNIFQIENDSELIVSKTNNSIKNSSELTNSEAKFNKITLALNFFYILLRSYDIISVVVYRSDLLNGISYRPSTVIIRNILYQLVVIVFSLNIVIILTFNKMFKYSLKNQPVRIKPAF